ncbi:phenylalanine--tRNA ligase subunit beta [Candidatus Gottesmanbacteria bacterium]|nr:phenylalanine--tRNA ligase subunit beta [Candidatus Gottesmanbacteria bacterium]
MNILLPDSWLREYLKTDASPKEIKEFLSLCGPSVERIDQVDTDYVYEIEITSNRVDMASVYGIAREAAAILPRFKKGANLKTLKVRQSIKPKISLPMQISDPQKICNRIMAIVLEVDPMKPSPDFIKDRIEKSGVRSLNNLVDITNYVMLEIGHPTHVFDYDRIKTHSFLIRKAQKNEPIITLDGKKYLLDPEDVIIDDGTGRVIDLPGIMGTENSVVNSSTRRILFFIESNNSLLIRKTSMRYGIRTVAATINEKHPDPELVKTALLRGIELYQKHAAAKVASQVIDIYPNKPTLPKIKVSTEFINDRLGVELKTQEIINILKSLSFDVLNSTDLLITPPSFRQFDVTIPEDIVEEVARIYGYHNLPNRLMTGEIPITDKPKDLPIEAKIKTILKYWGYTETYHYSFVSKSLIAKSGLSPKDHLRVANPLTEEIEYMRGSLVPSMLETISKNQYYKNSLKLFELAKVYIPQKGNLPLEPSRVVIAEQTDFYKLKGTVNALLKELGMPDSKLVLEKNTFFHPQQSAGVTLNGDTFAMIGKLHPSLASAFSLKDDLFIASINVENLVKLANPIKHYTPIPHYPAVIEDLTLLLQPKTQIELIKSEIYKVSQLVKNVAAHDPYQNAITLRITYQDESKNLESADIKKVRELILSTLKSRYNIILKQ